MNHLREPLQNLVEVLAGLTIMGRGLTTLDSDLHDSVMKAGQALLQPDFEPIKPSLGRALALKRKNGETEKEWRRRIIEAGSLQPEDDAAYCIGCGTYPKGLYTCATCVEADNHEGEQEHVSDWPARCP